MSAEIALFTKYDVVAGAQVLRLDSIYAVKTATFTTDRYCYARVRAISADVTLTVNTFALTVASGSETSFAIASGTIVTVS